MAKKPAKTASKNNPTQRNKGTAKKQYKNRFVIPIKIMDRDRGIGMISAQFEDDGSVVEDESGNPIKWDAI